MQSGALGYLADGCPRVVGLDGVVDAGAARALRERRLFAYAAERGVTHFADWDFNTQALATLSARSEVKPERLELLGVAAPQGYDRFRVFRVHWPSGAGRAPEAAPCASGRER
jgi:hypothetical protein